MRAGLALSLILAWPFAAGAGEVRPGPGALAAAIGAAEPGAELRLAPGKHEGAVEIDRPLSLICAEGAVIDGGGRGSVITVTAPDVVVRGCAIRGSGDDHQEIDSGVRLLEGATGAVVEDNVLTGNLYGVDIHGARDAVARGNRITGRDDHRMNSRGNGVYVWNAPGAKVVGNDIRLGRDGIFTNTSKDNLFAENVFRELRFAVHYMYTQDSTVRDNVSIGNHLGYAIMFSRGVRVLNNASIGDRDHGVMLNYANEGEVIGNYVTGVEDRALFIYNAHKNRIEGNRFEASGIGVHFTAGSERNAIAGNAFVANRMQVKYVGSKWVDWSEDGAGNHWSDHAAFDLDGDGIADAPYRPNDVIDRVLWTQPAARLLLGSPAIQLVRWAQRTFPATLPGGVIDRHPLMEPVTPPAMERGL
ncbi:MAG: nitrous oxide reductase family maturation protein NosD [Pseudomonadota bacterium]